MYSLKSFVIVALICSSLNIFGQTADDQQARLLVSKQVLNKILVQDSDILVKVCVTKYIINFFFNVLFFFLFHID